MAFIRMTRNALKMPDGFLGGLPGPLGMEALFYEVVSKA